MFRPAGLPPRNPGAVSPYRCIPTDAKDSCLRVSGTHTDTGLDCRGSEAVRSSPAADGEQKIASRRRGSNSRLPTIFGAEVLRCFFTLAPHRRCRWCLGPHQPPPGLSQHKSSGITPRTQIQPSPTNLSTALILWPTTDPRRLLLSQASVQSNTGRLVSSRYLATPSRPDSHPARPRWRRLGLRFQRWRLWFQSQGLHQLLDHGLGSYLPCLALTNKPGLECENAHAKS